jgi:hypothetical protein
MTDCIFELQKAIFSALDNDGAISGLVSGVYSHVPQDTSYPYIDFSSFNSSDWSTKTSSGIKATVVLNAYSQERGNKELQDIIHEVRRVLNGTLLSMSGCTMVNSTYVSSAFDRLSDGLIWKASVAFSFLVQEN